MKTTIETNKRWVPDVTIDPELNKYKDVVLLPKKLAMAKERLKKSGLPKLPKTKDSR